MPQDRTDLVSSDGMRAPSVWAAPTRSGGCRRTGGAIAISLVLLLSGCAGPRAQPREGDAPRGIGSATVLNPADLDRSVAPCEDFYRFANGGWMDRSTIPPDRSHGSMAASPPCTSSRWQKWCSPGVTLNTARPGSAAPSSIPRMRNTGAAGGESEVSAGRAPGLTGVPRSPVHPPACPAAGSGRGAPRRRSEASPRAAPRRGWGGRGW